MGNAFDDSVNWLGGALDDTWGALTGRTDYRPGLGQVDTSRMDPSRANSMGLQNELALAATGQGGPSAAQSQLNAGVNAGTRQQMALAASARGGAGQQAAAQRQGMLNAAAATGQASNEAAALRAREQQAASDRPNVTYHITVNGTRFRDGTHFEDWLDELRNDGRGGGEVDE
jgi:hypothetical protein